MPEEHLRAPVPRRPCLVLISLVFAMISASLPSHVLHRLGHSSEPNTQFRIVRRDRVNVARFS